MDSTKAFKSTCSHFLVLCTITVGIDALHRAVVLDLKSIGCNWD